VGAGIEVGAAGAGVLGAAAGAQAPSNILTPIKIDKTAIKRFIFNLLYLLWVISHRKSRKPAKDGKLPIFGASGVWNDAGRLLSLLPKEGMVLFQFYSRHLLMNWISV
jgi:hypothetical protein